MRGEVAETVIARINRLTPSSQPQWGKMSVDKMLAHLNVAYETIYEPGKHPAPNFFMKHILKLFVKPLVTGEKPMKRNSPTAPYFIIASDKDFEVEKARLLQFIRKTQQLGEQEFDGGGVVPGSKGPHMRSHARQRFGLPGAVRSTQPVCPGAAHSGAAP